MEATKPNAPQQPNAQAKPEVKKADFKKADTKTVSSNVKGIKNAIWVIILCFILAELFYLFVLGQGANFKFSDAQNYFIHWVKPDAVVSTPQNLPGTMYMGGFVVPFILTCLFTVIVLSVERFIALGKAAGKGSQTKFVANVKKALNNKNVAEAEELCRKQQGTVGAIVYSTLQKYKEMESSNLPKEQKLGIIQQQLEEATALEMPSLQQNLPICATLTTLGTLLGLFGTVIGMIRSFSALSQSGAPDSTALSTGISEALVNTASGIATASLALISYNYFTNKIDNLTYAVDELGFAIVNAYAANHEK